MRDRSILNGRHGVGRLLWRGPSPGGGDDFLLKLGGRGPGRSRVVRNTTPAQAFRELCEMHAELRAGTKPKVADSYTFGRLATEYFARRMEDVVRRGRRPSPRWVAQEQQHMELYVLPAFGSTPLARVDYKFAENLVRRLESTPGSKGDLLSRKTIREVLRIATAMLRWAKLREKLARLPFKLANLTRLLANEVDVHARKTAKVLRAWDDEEFVQFHRVRDLDLQIDRIASLACLNGPRPAELCLVTRSDVDRKKGTLRIDEAANNVRLRSCPALRDNPALAAKWRERHEDVGFAAGPLKSVNSYRTIYLDSESLEIIRLQLAFVDQLYADGKIDAEKRRYLFPNLHPQARTPFLSPERLRIQWRTRCIGRDTNGNVVGQPLEGVRYIPPYGWRHSCARQLLMKLELEEVASLLGHTMHELQRSYNDWIPAFGRNVALKKEGLIAEWNGRPAEGRGAEDLLAELERLRAENAVLRRGREA